MLDHTKLGAPTDNFFAKPEELDAMVCDKGGKTFAKRYLASTPYELHFGR